ncbi:MAG: metallophosphoesterase [Muribaculaceae bacterium]|nr:metallophosphoesterase [Muribaculaceae bacterium]
MRIPVVMMIIMLLGSVLVDLYITSDIRKSANKPFWWKVYLVSAVLCWLFMAVVLCLPRRSESSDILPVMWMLYSIITVYAAKLVYVIFSLIGKVIRSLTKRKSRNHPMQWVGTGVAVLVFGAMWWGVGETRHEIVVTHEDITSPKVPLPFNGYKIAQISDIHVGTWGKDTAFISALVDSVNSLHPDLIVFTGDIVNRRTDELVPFIPVLSRLHAPDGVLSILGNHDYGDYVDWKDPQDRIKNNQKLADYQKDMGWDLLNNRKIFVTRGNDSIMVVGVENVGDPPFPTYGDLDLALSPSPDSLYNQNDHHYKILLTHNPEHWNEYVSHHTNIDLSLAGHTHAMQMMFKLGDWVWSPAKYRYEQWGGMYDRLNENGHLTKLYVNIGAGEVGMPSRLFAAYPEITLLTLHHQTQHREMD